MITVGQTLWYVPEYRNGYRPHEVEVVSVGRKWIGVSDGHRIDKDTLEADGGKYSSPGRCYLSREEWERIQGIRDAWSQLRRDVNRHYTAPGGVSAEAIKQARALLGLREEPAG